MTQESDWYIEGLLSAGSSLQAMIEVEYPLYRYRGNIEYALDEIRGQYVYTSYVGAQNDPFDSTYRLTLEEALASTNSVYYYFHTFLPLQSLPNYKQLQGHMQEFFDNLVSLKDFCSLLSTAFEAIGERKPPNHLAEWYFSKYYRNISHRDYWQISCFSEKWNSLPMWAYYASNHTGFCFKYDLNILDRANDYHTCILNSLHKVWYSDNKPYDAKGRYSCLVKAQDWSHEQEWRLINWRSTPRVSLPCMTEVYVGINADTELLGRAVSAIRDSGKEIRLYQCRPSLHKYEIELLKINF